MTKKTNKEEVAVADRNGPEFREIELNKIESNPWQPRKTAPTDEEIADLMNSIKAVGQTSPIRVRPNPTKEGRFQVGDGAMRIQSMRALGLKTIRAIIEPLTDKQMKILAIAANIFVKLRDSDKEKAVYELWDSEYRGESKQPIRGQFSGEFVNISEMSRETGIEKGRITHFLQAYVGRMAISREAPKELKAAVKDVSTMDMESIAKVAKESTKIAQQLVEARASDTIRSVEVRDIVKTLQETPPAEREKVVQDILAMKGESHEAKAKIDKQVEDGLAKTREKYDAEYEKVRKEKARTQAEEDDKETERKRLKDAQEAMVTKTKEDAKLLVFYTNFRTAGAFGYVGDDRKRQIDNIRDDRVRTQTVEEVKTIAALFKKFANRFE